MGSCRAQDIGDHKLPTNTRQGYLQLYKHQYRMAPGALLGVGLFRKDPKRFRAWMILGGLVQSGRPGSSGHGQLRGPPTTAS